MMPISNYLDARLVVFLESTTRDRALYELVAAADNASLLPDREAFYNAVLERERLVSCGIGMQVAIPHAKLKGFSDFFVAVGISKTGIDWDALDSQPVRLVFLIGGPDDKQTEYLQLLSQLTRIIRHEPIRQQMMQAGNAQRVLRLLTLDSEKE